MFELIAATCAGLFAGAACFITIVHHPAASALGDETAARLFPPMYRRAAPMQAGLAVVGSVAGLLAALTGGGALPLLGALLLGSIVPYTLVRMKPTNDQLLAPGLDPAAPEIPGLLERWGRMHGVRSLLSSLAFLIFLAG